MKAIKREFKKLKKILLPILLVLLSSLFVFAVVKITSIKTKTISSFEYSVGSIDEATGMYKEDDQALYTKEAIECRGLTIKPGFDASVSYQVFWYNVDALYFGCTEVYSSSYKLLPQDVPEFARYCRIVIYPSQLDDEGNDIEDFKVRFYQTVSYANQLSVKVDKVQTFDCKLLYDTISYEDFKNYGSLDKIDFEYALFIENCTYSDNISDGAIASRSFLPSTSLKTVILNLENIDRWQLNASFVGDDVNGFFSLDENYKKIPRSVFVSNDINGLLSWKNYGSYAIIIYDSNSVVEFVPYLPRNEITEALYK